MRRNFFGKHLLIAFSIVTVFLLTPILQASAKYPDKPIVMIDPWPPGGAVDVAGRVIASVGAEYLGQPLVMRYRSGAAGVRGAEYVSRAKPDGYTIGLLGFGAITTQMASQPERATYTHKDFIPIAQISASPVVFLANPKAPFKTMKEFLAYIKENPGKIVFSSSGRFGVIHVAFARLQRATGTEGTMVHLPTKGGGPAVKECLGAHSLVTGALPGVAFPHIRAKTLIPLGLCDEKRWTFLPEVPTVKELIGKSCVTKLWITAVVPKGTPADRVSFLREKFKQILEDKSVKKLFKRLGERIEYMSGEDFAAFWEKEWEEAKGLAKLLLEK